jgi:hypothetical protein
MAINTAQPVQKYWSITHDQASIAANLMAVSSAKTALGAKVDGIFHVKRPSALNLGLSVTAECTTADQIVLRFVNHTAGAIDPASMAFEVVMI